MLSLTYKKMAQPAQRGTGRNTIIGPRAKSRYWFFTLNNYMQAEVRNLQSDKYQYIFQEEVAGTGTKHLQGTIRFPNAMRLASMKQLNARAHWEICDNFMACINYCKKNRSRIGKIYSNFDWEKNGTVGTGTTNKNFVLSEDEKKMYIEEGINYSIEENRKIDNKKLFGDVFNIEQMNEACLKSWEII